MGEHRTVFALLSRGAGGLSLAGVSHSAGRRQPPSHAHVRKEAFVKGLPMCGCSDADCWVAWDLPETQIAND